MKFSAIIATLLSVTYASDFQCSKSSGSFECFQVEAEHVCPTDYYHGLPSCVGIAKSFERRPCDATTEWAKCIKQGRPLGCNCDSTLGK